MGKPLFAFSNYNGTCLYCKVHNCHHSRVKINNNIVKNEEATNEVDKGSDKAESRDDEFINKLYKIFEMKQFNNSSMSSLLINLTSDDSSDISDALVLKRIKNLVDLYVLSTEKILNSHETINKILDILLLHDSSLVN